ncbi:MAG: hypothetical protein Q4D73_00745 [Actinomycetaceae bacterium]|nr:hypothetical protein [Actinomycetaceae bacterium]
MRKQKLMLLAAPLVALAFAGCTQSAEPKAPYLPGPSELNSIGVFYTIEKIEVTGNDVCAFDKQDRLLVFSEEVKVNPEHNALIFKDSEIPIGVEAIGSDFKELPDGFACGGKTYPAIHILGEGLYLVKDE